MSYILDALRKADHERNIGDVPDLETPHWIQQRTGPVRHWVLVVIGLLILNGALLAMLFNRDGSGDGSAAVSGLVPDPGISMEPPQALQHDNVTQPRQPDVIPLKPLARREDTVIKKPRPLVQKPATLAPLRTTPAARESAAPVTKPVRASTSEIPEWGELSLEFRSGFNPPHMDVHVYDEESSRRFILVRLQRYVEGDTLDSGAKLEKIMPGGIQLYYQGTRFRIDR